MRILRLPNESVIPGDALTNRLRNQASDYNEAAITVWYPPRTISFSKRDTHQAGYSTATTIAESNGYETNTRQTGGTAVAFTGATLSFTIVYPDTDPKTNIQTRFDDTIAVLQRTFWELGIPAQQGEPPESFCAGNHSLQFRGKLAGVAQHISNQDAIVGGIVIVDQRDETERILEEIYSALNYDLDPQSIGSLSHIQPDLDRDSVTNAIETAFAGDDALIERLDRNQ